MSELMKAKGKEERDEELHGIEGDFDEIDLLHSHRR